MPGKLRSTPFSGTAWNSAATVSGRLRRMRKMVSSVGTVLASLSALGPVTCPFLMRVHLRWYYITAWIPRKPAPRRNAAAADLGRPPTLLPALVDLLAQFLGPIAFTANRLRQTTARSAGDHAAHGRHRGPGDARWQGQGVGQREPLGVSSGPGGRRRGGNAPAGRARAGFDIIARFCRELCQSVSVTVTD